MMEDEPLLSVQDLTKHYPDGTIALRGVNLSVPRGQLLAVVGPSGAGKSTLLRCVNRLVEPSDGTVLVGGRDVTRARRRELRAARRDIGMVFQEFQLVERLPAVRNVLHGRLGHTNPLSGALGMFSAADVEEALRVLTRVGLADQAFKRCSELSGGQKQRVGVARSIVQRAPLVLADEPIASLDMTSAETVMESLRTMVREEGRSVVVNLHQVDFATAFADRIVGLRGGEQFCDLPADQLDDGTVHDLYRGSPPERDGAPPSSSIAGTPE